MRCTVFRGKIRHNVPLLFADRDSISIVSQKVEGSMVGSDIPSSTEWYSAEPSVIATQWYSAEPSGIVLTHSLGARALTKNLFPYIKVFAQLFSKSAYP